MAYPLPTDFFQLHWFLPSRFCHPPTTSLIRSRPTDQVWRTGWTRKKSRISLSTHLKLVIVFSTHHKLAYSNDCHWLEFVFVFWYVIRFYFLQATLPWKFRLWTSPTARTWRRFRLVFTSAVTSPRPGLPNRSLDITSQRFFLCLIFFVKKSHICLEGQLLTPPRGGHNSPI